MKCHGTNDNKAESDCRYLFSRLTFLSFSKAMLYFDKMKLGPCYGRGGGRGKAKPSDDIYDGSLLRWSFQWLEMLWGSADKQTITTTNINNSDQQQQHNGVDNHDFIREKMDATENCIALTKVRSMDNHDDTFLIIESCSNGFTLYVNNGFILHSA